MEIITTDLGIREMSSLFSALADPTRLNIVMFLYRRDRATVQEIAKSLLKSQSLISHHLSCLKNCGVVNYQRDGRFVYYYLNGDGIRKIVEIALRHVADYGRSIMSCDIINESTNSQPTGQEFP